MRPVVVVIALLGAVAALMAIVVMKGIDEPVAGGGTTQSVAGSDEPEILSRREPQRKRTQQGENDTSESEEGTIPRWKDIDGAPTLVELVGDETVRKVENQGPWERADLPVLGRAVRRMETYIDTLEDGSDERSNLEVQESYLALQHAYFQVVRQLVGDDSDPVAAARLAEFEVARESLMAELVDATDEERADAIGKLKAKMLMGDTRAEAR